MNDQSTLLAVRDMERSKCFYCGLLGMTVTDDFSANVTLSDRGLSEEQTAKRMDVPLDCVLAMKGKSHAD